jgi:hypothetical protein
VSVPRAKDERANERTRRRLGYAMRRRDSLIEVLAPDLRCAECGDQHASASELVVDHVDGITWNRYKCSPQMRAARYWREHELGVPLRALCMPCSENDGRARKKIAPRRWS